MLQGFNDDNLYLIDMSYLNSPAEFVFELTPFLENEQAKNKKIKLKIGGIELSQAQLSGIQSLFLSINSSLEVIDGTSEISRVSSLSNGILFENSSDMIPSENAFLNEIKTDGEENHQENETFDENQNPEQASEQEQNLHNEDFSAESETACQIDNNNPTEEVFQPEQNLQDENIDENKTEEAQQQEPLCDFPQQPEQNEEFIPQEPFQENNQAFETPAAEDSTGISAETAESSEFSDEVTFENEENLAENEESNPSSIPENSVIQEELSIIYGTEKKLEDVFESTGIKEAKFASFKDAATAEEREYTKFDFELEAFPTKYLKQNICAGQVISFDGHLVIIGDCHEGSELSASGDITVWGELSGSAYAGMNGNEKAKIRALRMNASYLRISTCSINRPYALENSEIKNQPLIPEEASINKGEIGVYKIFK